MARRTRGHFLLEQWVLSHGESTRSQGRPSFEALQEAVRELEREAEVVREAQAPKHAGQLYHYLATSGDGVLRTPRRALRALIELVTRGEVPRDAWNETVEEPEDRGAA